MSETVLYPDLKNKIVLVTGATRGIGRAIAEQLAKQGAHLVFNYRSNPEAAQTLAEEFKKLGASKATPLQFDVTDSTKIKTELDGFIAANGPITGLVNNAGISKDQLLLRIKEDDVDQILDTNLKSTIMISAILSRSFLKANDVSVVNISSIVGLMGNASQAVYAASKAGLIGLTKSFAKELASRNIRCNAICPGFIETDMTNQLEDKVKEAYLSQVPLNRFGNANEVANLVCFLLSKTSAYITGETIKIDGGLYI